jgi:hypothetical protein
MARKKSPLLAKRLRGKLRFTKMVAWQALSVDLRDPTLIGFEGQKRKMRSITVTASLNIRYDARSGKPITENSWEGVEEGDQHSGCGRLARRLRLSPCQAYVYSQRRRFRVRLGAVATCSTTFHRGGRL